MSNVASAKERLGEAEILRRINQCPKLGSLRSISSSLSKLVAGENTFTTEVAEIISKDPTLTSRVLKLVNSVFFGLAHKVSSVEEAVIYLGFRQLRELAFATPVIEDFSKMNQGSVKADWSAFWEHCIGTAMLTRELMATAKVPVGDDADYISGLVHDVGKLVMASVFPDEFNEIHSREFSSPEALCAFENDLLGFDHAEIGSLYLKNHQLPDLILCAVRNHNTPSATQVCSKLSAAIQIADYMLRSIGVVGIENVQNIELVQWEVTEGWSILFPEINNETLSRISAIEKSLLQLPDVLRSMVG